MKRLYTYILKSFAGPFLFTLLVSVFILLMSSIWRYVDKLAGRDLPISVILEFFGYYAVTTLYMAIPLAILLSSIMTLGNLGERYELIAMKAAGISLFRILKPLIFIVISLAFLTFYISNYVAPVSLFKAKSLLSDMVNKNPEFILKEGTFISDMPNATIKVEKVSKEDDGRFYDAIIYQKSPSGKILKTITAQSGRMASAKDLSFMTIWLYKGRIYEEDDRNASLPFTRTAFDEYMVVTPMKKSDFERSEKEINKNNYRMLTYQQLDTLINDLKVRREEQEVSINELLTKEYYFKKTPRDSTLSNKMFTPNNIDSVFSKYPIEEQAVILSSALGDAKTSEEYLRTKEEYFSMLQTYTAKAEEHWHQKFNWPFACLIFFLVGASLGAIVRKGGFGMPVLISILFFIAYYMMNKYGSNFFVAKEIFSAYIGNWIGTVLFLILGVWLTYKAATDSALMDADIYKKLMKRTVNNKIAKCIKQFIPFVKD